MANEKDFKSLIDEQKKTTEALTQVAQNTANTGEEVGDSSKKRERSEKELAADGVRREKALERIRKAASPIGKLKGAFGKVSKFLKGSGSKDKEKQKDDNKNSDSRFKRLGDFLGNPLKKIGDSLKGYGKKAISGIGTLFKFGIMGAALLIVKNFLESPKWEEWKKNLIPALVKAFDFISATLKMAGDLILNGISAFSTLFSGMFEADGSLKGFKGQIQNLKDNFGCLLPAFAGLGTAIVGIALLLAPKALAFGAIKLALGAAKGGLKFAMKVLRLFFSKTMYTRILRLVGQGAKGGGKLMMRALGLVGKALTAMRVFLMSSMIPAITGFMAPFIIPLALLAAAVAAAVAIFVSIKAGIEEFKCSLANGDSMLVAIIEGVSTALLTLVTLPITLIKKFVAWVAKKLGFEGIAEKLNEFNIVDFIKDGVKKLFSSIGKWVSGIYEDYIKPLLAPLLKFFDPAINVIKKVFNFIMDAIQPIVDFISKIAAKVGGFIKKIASKLNPLSWFGGGDDEKVENLDGVVSSSTAAEIELDKADNQELVTTLPRATLTAETAFPAETAMAQQSSTAIINAPMASNTVTTNNQNIVKTVVEPDAYFLRQAGWAI